MEVLQAGAQGRQPANNSDATLRTEGFEYCADYHLAVVSAGRSLLDVDGEIELLRVAQLQDVRQGSRRSGCQVSALGYGGIVPDRCPAYTQAGVKLHVPADAAGEPKAHVILFGGYLEPGVAEVADG